MSGSSTVHWLVNPLYPACVSVLKSAQKGLFYHQSKRFEIAYLIARECLSFDGDKDSIKLTAKGEDALVFYAEEKTIAG